MKRRIYNYKYSKFKKPKTTPRDELIQKLYTYSKHEKAEKNMRHIIDDYNNETDRDLMTVLYKHGKALFAQQLFYIKLQKDKEEALLAGLADAYTAIKKGELLSSAIEIGQRSVGRYGNEIRKYNIEYLDQLDNNNAYL